MIASARTRHGAVAAVVALAAAFEVIVTARPGSSGFVTYVDDLGEAVAAVLGALPCFWRAHKQRGRARLSWALLGAGLLSWAAGECVWSYYSLVRAIETPFPSLADAGFLLLPILALAGLLLMPSSARSATARSRVVLDGTMVAAALLALSWSISLSSIFTAGGQSSFALTISLAYPVSDIVMITVAVLVIRTQRTAASALMLAGLVAMSVSDTLFSYLTAAGTYSNTLWADGGWVSAFLLIGLSAFYPGTEHATAAPTQRADSLAAVLLPYSIVLTSAGIVVAGIVHHTSSPLTLVATSVAVVALLVRQMLMLLDNRRLTIEVLAQRDELRHLAFHDALTGLANRALFHDRLGHALDLHERDGRPVSVVFIDLDDFKLVNDSYGHDVGDALLVGVAERLTQATRTGDTVARLGGDEFAILVEDDGDADSLAARLQDALHTPVELNGRTVPMHGSVGVTQLDPGTGYDLAAVIRQADLAMYAAKDAGKGRSVVYNPVLLDRDGVAGDLEMQQALADDVRAGNLQTAFQPILRPDGEVYAIEALARWTFRNMCVMPDRFIPLARRTGLLHELDLLVTANALRHLRDVAEPGDPALVSVNFALHRSLEIGIPQRLAEMLAENGLTGASLMVEVPESEALTDPDTAEAIGTLRAQGIRVAIDDFGTGFSNLDRLSELRPDIVKIDRTFIEPLKQPGTSNRFLARVVALIHEMDAEVIAEGVETERQHRLLADIGCDALQGFYLGVPVVGNQPVAGRTQSLRAS